MKIGKFKKIAAIGLTLAMSIGLIHSGNIVNATDDQPDTDAIQLEKTAFYDEDENSYKIRLEAYTTGTVTSSTKKIPADIVLVLDQSSSMAECIKCGKEKEDHGRWTGHTFESKQEALIDAVESFTNAIAEDATTNSVNHRVAMVGFASDNTGGLNYNNSELFYGINNTKKYNQLTKSDYEKAFQDMSTSQGQTNISNYIEKLDANGGTAIDLGMEMASKVLEYNPVDSGEERQRIVVVFTDGVPGIYSLGWNGDSQETKTQYANRAISKANTIKETATVYTIGVFSGASNSNPSGGYGYSIDWNNSNTFNYFMHTLSSDYPNAKLMSNRGNLASGITSENSHYMPASDSESLNDVFDKIKEDVGSAPDIELENAVIKDTMSNYFKLPNGFTKDDVELKEATYLGDEKWSEETDLTAEVSVNVDSTTNTVSVSGYDFDSNFVHEASSNITAGGKKLIIEFKIEPISGFIGGLSVPTNTENISGIYESNQSTTPLKTFGDSPTVDVDLNYDYDVSDQGMYVGSVWNEFNKFLNLDSNNSPQYKIGNVTYSLSDSYVNDFVDVVYTIYHVTENSGGETVKTAIATYTVEAGQKQGNLNIFENTDFTTTDFSNTENCEISVSVKNDEGRTPTSDELDHKTQSNTGVTNENKNAKLYIFVPNITTTDETIFLGENTDLSDRITVGENWECTDNTLTDNNLTKIRNTLGTAPNLSYSYAPSDGVNNNIFTPEKAGNTLFTVTVMNGGIDITDRSKFTHNVEDCDECNGNCQDCNENGLNNHFIIHVVDGEITISKSIANPGQYDSKDGNPIFTYLIEKKNDEGNYEVYAYKYIKLNDATDDQNNIAVLSGLAKGKYRITELSSLRYSLDSISIDNVESEATTAEVTIDENGKSHNVHYVNKVKSKNYDSDNDVLVNKFEFDESSQKIKVNQVTNISSLND